MEALDKALQQVQDALALIQAGQTITGTDRDDVERLLEEAARNLRIVRKQVPRA